eukprot:snap_masked-scaffold_51-processed-gene-0.28-mRNA-1 protein AED:1.00 eAED:1.00 QI:0/0/0/0/1/1/2/0/350
MFVPSEGSGRAYVSARIFNNYLNQNDSDEHLRDSAVMVVSVASIINTIVQLLALVIYIDEAEKGNGEFLFLFTLGFSIATILRFCALCQYYSDLSPLTFLLNLLLGSRFGWKEKYSIKAMQKTHPSVQFGFPLVLHSVADLIFEGLTSFVLVILFIEHTQNPRVAGQSTLLIICLIINTLKLIETSLIRVGYGVNLVTLSALVVFAIVNLAFNFSLIAFGDIERLGESVYTSDFYYAWFRFFAFTISGFYKTAYEVRSGKFIPGMSKTFVGLSIITVVDTIAALLIFVDPDSLINSEDIELKNVLVDNIILANIYQDLSLIGFLSFQRSMALNKEEQKKIVRFNIGSIVQ